MSNKPVPPPQQTAEEQPPMAPVVGKPSPKKSIWLFVGSYVLLVFLVFLAFLVFARGSNSLVGTSRPKSDTSTSRPNSGTSRSSGSPSRLIGPDTSQWLAVNTEAHRGPSEDATVVGKMNRGASVVVVKDDGSGWVEVYGFSVAIYKSSSWIRYPDEFLDIQQNVFVRKKHLTPRPPRS